MEIAIARMVTRPGCGTLEGLEDVNVTPDLMMCTLMKEGADLLKSNTIYELVLNRFSGAIELKERGEANIGKKWGLCYYDIPIQHGKQIWLTKEELKQI